ncbi:MAG: hypothetical protein Kow00107_01210 [Planctomycetota bacterium]
MLSISRRMAEPALFVNGKHVPSKDPVGDYLKALETASANTVVELKAEVTYTDLELEIVLGSRAGLNPPMKPSGDLWPSHIALANPGLGEAYSKAIETAVGKGGIKEEYDDLRARLSNLHNSSDPFRREAVAAVHRDPFVLEKIVENLRIQYTEGNAGNYDLFSCVTQSMDLGRFSAEPLQTGLSPEEHVNQITSVLESAHKRLQAAFADLSQDEIAFIMQTRHQLTDAFIEHIYLHIDPDKSRREANLKLLKLAERVDFRELALAALHLMRFSEHEYIVRLKEDLLRAYADQLEKEVIATFQTPYGPIVIGGTTRHWYADTHSAMIIDLGGDDFYSNNSGSGASLSLLFEKNEKGEDIPTKPIRGPFGVVIDYEGDDAYESTRRWEIGSGSLGCGLLVDLEGNDEYRSIQWGQGSGFFGFGMLLDMSGDDDYVGRELCHAAAIFGAALHFDGAGNDRFHGNEFCQGLAGAGSASLLVNKGGDDLYFAKGSRPTNYGDPGIYDGWSQGCGIGFRMLASGGVGMLVDTDGRDRYEAGNFSQGGGYYFGLGILGDFGSENDYYMGSRYNQGFSAHQAVGAFVDWGGNDSYSTRQGVSQGLAWDECVTLFIDRAGDDSYFGGTGFSLGATAHNSICIFHDRDGSDSYTYNGGPARAGGNDYHGGCSFSLFVDSGTGEDTYSAKSFSDSSSLMRREFSLFIDLKGSFANAIAEGGWADKLMIADLSPPAPAK